MAASAPCHNATLFDLYFAHGLKPTMAAVGDSFVGGLDTWAYQRESGSRFLEAQGH